MRFGITKIVFCAKYIKDIKYVKKSERMLIQVVFGELKTWHLLGNSSKYK